MAQQYAQHPAGQKLVIDLMDALNSSLDLKRVASSAVPILAKLVAADYGALCVSQPESAGGYDWFAVDFPVDWFRAYPEMAPHDFVRESVLKRPNTVLIDSDMLPRREVESNVMYRYSREIGVPLEHVMSVMLDAESGWHAGITLYRSQCHGFSEEDRLTLQELTRPLVNAVRNCKLVADMERRDALINSILRHEAFEAVFFSPRLVELTRTEGLGSLLDRWFSCSELARTGLPDELMDKLRHLIQDQGRGRQGSSTWTRDDRGAFLRVMFLPLPEDAGTVGWALLFHEVYPMPRSWEEVLTQAECEVVKYILVGWDNRLIAEEVGCQICTVKKHVQHIFDKLGVPRRSALCHLAAKMR